MKMVAIIFIGLLVLKIDVTAQPGKYATPELKKMIGAHFNDERSVSGLKGYSFQESTLLNRLDDPERLFLNVYKNGTSRVVLFSVLIDTAKYVFKILDVLQVKDVKPGFEFKSVTCRQHKKENTEIVALVNPREQQFFTDVKKAWICDRKKRSFTAIPVKGIDCLNEGYELY